MESLLDYRRKNSQYFQLCFTFCLKKKWLHSPQGVLSDKIVDEIGAIVKIMDCRFFLFSSKEWKNYL